MTNWCEEKRMDASIAQMMWACADDEGAILLESYGQSTPQSLPEGLDDQCKRLIEKNFSRRQTRVVVNHIVKTFCMTLLCLFGLLGIGTVTVMSVESLREPVLKVFDDYYVEITHEKMTVSGIPQDITNGEEFAKMSSDMLLKLLPEGYVCEKEDGDSIDFYLAIFRGGKYGRVGICMIDLGAISRTNTEGAWLLEKIELRGCSAYLIGMKSYTAIQWIDEERKITAYLDAENISTEELVDLAERFIDQLPPPESQLSE